MRTATAASLLALGALAGCAPERSPGLLDAGPPDGGLAFLPERHTDFLLSVRPDLPDGGEAVSLEGPRAPEADAGVAAPAPLPLLSVEAVLPDGPALSLARDGISVVEPQTRFRAEVSARLDGARFSLLDARDALVAADGTTEAAATTRFTLTPAAPLRPGSSYTLRLDGAEGRLLRDEGGRAFEPVSLALRVSGEPPAPSRRGRRSRRR